MAKPRLDEVPAGWSREAYAGECERMAAVCRAVRPDLSAEWSARAKALRAAIPPEAVPPVFHHFERIRTA